MRISLPTLTRLVIRFPTMITTVTTTTLIFLLPASTTVEMLYSTLDSLVESSNLFRKRSTDFRSSATSHSKCLDLDMIRSASYSHRFSVQEETQRIQRNFELWTHTHKDTAARFEITFPSKFERHELIRVRTVCRVTHT